MKKSSSSCSSREKEEIWFFEKRFLQCLPCVKDSSFETAIQLNRETLGEVVIIMLSCPQAMESIIIKESLKKGESMERKCSKTRRENVLLFLHLTLHSFQD